MEDWIILSKTVIETCFNIRGQTAIVTGASRGLGVMFAETLAELGREPCDCCKKIQKTC
jgi:short-subunit dehydrogenase involved in D-alanine esterification of teichoic acids